MKRPRRRLISFIPLSLAFLLLDEIKLQTLLLLPVALLGMQWYFFGSLFILLVGVFLIYSRTGGIYGLAAMSLAVLSIEMAYLDRERAPRGHYIVLIAAILLSIPSYLLLEALAPILPSVEVTALAALVLVLAYLFALEVGKG